jgi:neutral ceramidase
MCPEESVVTFRAGAASTNVDPPLGLEMIGVVRRVHAAKERLGALEVTAAAFESGSTRVVLCGVDTALIQAPEVDELRRRIELETGAARAGILLNWNHTHHAPPGGRSLLGWGGTAGEELTGETLEYIDTLHGAIVATCVHAFESAEKAFVRWAVGFADLVVNRRQRDPDGNVTKIGWEPTGVADSSVPVLQSIRPGGDVIATVVGYGAHTVTTGVEYLGYSPDFPGPLRETVRAVTGGECVFLQGAGGNIMPRFAFDEDLREPQRMGARLAIEALHAISDQPAEPIEIVETSFGSGTTVALFRQRPTGGAGPALEAIEEEVSFPLLPLPTLAAIRVELEEARETLAAAEARGASEEEIRILRFHGLNWARATEAEIASGSPRTAVSGPVSAIRIGDGAIVTGPGEIFSEIGLAVKERSPADVTLYAGYSNGAISYMPTASEYPRGGYEPSYGHKSYLLPAQVAPETERLLIETGARLVCSLFPERSAPAVDGWLFSGTMPRELPSPRWERPEVVT